MAEYIHDRRIEIECEAIEKYKEDITQIPLKKTEAKYGYLRVDGESKKFETWKDGSVHDAKVLEAQNFHDTGHPIMIASVVTLVAALILLCVFIGTSPIASAVTFAALGFTTLAVGVTCVGLFIATIHYGCKVDNILKEFGIQHVLHAQQVLKRDLPLLPEGQRSTHAEYVKKMFGHKKHGDFLTLSNKCEEKVKLTLSPVPPTPPVVPPIIPAPLPPTPSS
jgi:hypothetical protein